MISVTFVSSLSFHERELKTNVELRKRLSRLNKTNVEVEKRMSRLNKRNTEIEKRRSYVKMTNILNFDRKYAPYATCCKNIPNVDLEVYGCPKYDTCR